MAVSVSNQIYGCDHFLILLGPDGNPNTCEECLSMKRAHLGHVHIGHTHICVRTYLTTRSYPEVSHFY